MDKEERIRQRAYELWYGCLSGRDQEHWEQACHEIEGETAFAPADADPTAAKEHFSAAYDQTASLAHKPPLPPGR